MMVERLKQIISHFGISDRQFALSCGIAQNTLSRQLNGARELSLTTVYTVLSCYPEISAEWLLRGTGEMLLTSEQPTASNENDRLSKLIDTIAFQQDTINNLHGRIKELETTNKRLETQVALYIGKQIV